MTDPANHNRISILKTVVKVKSFIVMLDFECDVLISKIFQHFHNAISDYFDVIDLVYALVKALNKGMPGKVGIYNVSRGKGKSVREFDEAEETNAWEFASKLTV